jgi:dienelactone hydrolase
MRQHKDAYHEALKSVLGAPPDPAPLNPEVLEVDTLTTHRREKIRIQTHPGDWCYAYLLIPHHLPQPLPTIICHHRHNRDWSLGKSEVVGLRGDPEEAFGQELVERGYLVFAPDALCFEDRRPNQQAGAENNFRELVIRLLRGETLLKKVIWDIQRGLDYLQMRPEVDQTRVGFMGHGYGAKMALWSMAFDERLSVAAAHGSLGSMKYALELGHVVQYEFSVPRLLQVADYDRILSLAAPRPFLLSATIQDPDSADVNMVFEKAYMTYARAGVANRLGFYHYQNATLDEPWMTIQARHRMYDWFDQWLHPY